MEKDTQKRIRLMTEVKELVEKTFPSNLHQQEIVYSILVNNLEIKIREHD